MITTMPQAGILSPALMKKARKAADPVSRIDSLASAFDGNSSPVAAAKRAPRAAAKRVATLSKVMLDDDSDDGDAFSDNDSDASFD